MPSKIFFQIKYQVRNENYNGRTIWGQRGELSPRSIQITLDRCNSNILMLSFSSLQGQNINEKIHFDFG